MVVSRHAGGISDYIPPASQPAARKRRGERHIRILSYNMFLRPLYATDKHTSAEDDFKDERLEFFLREVDQFDVLALQEVWIVCAERRFQWFLKEAVERGFQHWSRSGCYPLQGKPSDGMLLILSRHPLLRHAEVTYDSCSSIDCHASKGALAVRIRPFSDVSCDFELLDTHLQAGRKEDIVEARAGQLSQLRAFVDARGSTLENISTVIAGDFNVDAGSGEHRQRVVGNFPDFFDVLLADGRPSFSTADFGGVATAEPQKVARRRLDYILHKPGKGSRRSPNSSVIEAFVVQGQKFTTLSDHFGVTTTMAC